jgi:hypothetical protein
MSKKEEFMYEPMFNKVIITLNTEEVDNDLVLSDNTMSETQTIVAVGPTAHGLSVGDKVLIDLDKMTVREMNPENSHETLSRIKIDPVFVDDVMYAIIEDRVVKAKYRNK